ncbi:uncharacterized protein CANTADRAFT_24791 [Suhomyces tanzawaensis NRRL Y-17324]|uniref:Conserved oligomeric Golgi complex subunit 2 n=1 Tax=Suhomyces tanzawaensis NRRL Y-17324 TaxID=984487 RepID=A0A1E4SRM3_9ASCO|nr:uncharacterized protein CANTADRAFT_24791 [Suhomyces tanzawaensis NRRL Y-17324]ODV82151.1 hypothetical protein CANTADRAFT_24791 [Suhomyces tanzawaensis NRRL Y-17324]
MDSEPSAEAFPFPVSINRTDFKTFDQSNIDEFLYKYHRYTSIDVLIKELSALSKELNQSLLDLVNSDYDDFIRLGKSINGGVELIDSVSSDLKSFKLDLVGHASKLEQSQEAIGSYLRKREALVYVKTLAKLNVLLNDQTTSFELTLLADDNTVPEKITKLRTLTGLYLSISNFFAYLTSSSPSKEGLDTQLTSEFTTNYLTNKISSLKLEFKSYLDATLSIIKVNSTADSRDLALLVLNVYKIIGHEGDVVAALKR